MMTGASTKEKAKWNGSVFVFPGNAPIHKRLGDHSENTSCSYAQVNASEHRGAGNVFLCR
jgi:hypothetical protein